jgi:hypothetical protein
MPKPLWKNQSSEMSLVFFSSSGVPILMGDNEGKSEECFFIEKEFFKTGGSPASKSTSTTVLEARGDADKVAKGCLKNTLVSAPKGDPNLVSTTMRSAEGSGAVIRHSNDTFQRGLWATPRQSVANWFAGQHSKPMSSFFGLYTLHSQNFPSMGGSRKRGLSSNSGAPGNWTTEAHRVDGLGPGWASSKSDFFMSDLLHGGGGA